ncbi:MAG: response regulator [Chlorobium sp.]|nr:ATP-binding protein [Chlorobium phaeovibrioides]NQU46941.1 response regulator [Chlorobium sp.]
MAAGSGRGKVKIDPSQIDQIVANLFVNARDAISGMGTITIETRRITQPENDHPTGVMERKPGRYIALLVSDTGKGMSSEMMHSIFEPFFTTKDIGKGTGLGLSTVYGIVKQNGGFLDVESEPEKGSRFTVCIPECSAANTNDMADHAAASLAKRSEDGDKVVLIVEDEADILRLCTCVLRGEGFTVLTASSPAQAMEVAGMHAGGIDLLLTDVIMPGMNGGDLHRALLEKYPALRVVFMSGYTADIIGANGVSGEGLNFIQKPFPVRNLIRKVQEVLDLPSPLQ